MSYIDKVEQKLIFLKQKDKSEIVEDELKTDTFCKHKINDESEFDFCLCSWKEKLPYDYIIEGLEGKRLEFVNLQKNIINLRKLKQKKIRSDAKLLKLAINSKCQFSLPYVKMNLETLTRITYENEVVQSELCYLNNKNAEQELHDIQLEMESNAAKFFKNVNEQLYKMFEVRIGHLNGENRSIFLFLSSQLLYIVGDNCSSKINEMKYEDIQSIIVGMNERWFGIVSSHEGNVIQVDVGDACETKKIIKYLEIAIRRRFIAIAIRKQEEKGINENVDINGNRQFYLPEFATSSKYMRFSYGRWLESLIPSVLSCSNQEAHFIENWLMEQLNCKERPRVLACWLVFWESGSEFLCDKEAQVDLGPSSEGFLMVNNSSLQRNSWVPAYFFLKLGILYQFRDSCDKLPHLVIRVRDYCGCQRLPSSSRPYAFQLLKQDGDPLSFAAPNEDTASQWLQAFLRLLSNDGDSDFFEERRLKPCQVIQTAENLILSYQNNVMTFVEQKSLNSKESLKNIEKLKKRNQGVNSVVSKPVNTSNSLLHTPRTNSVPLENEEGYHLAECPPTPPIPKIKSPKHTPLPVDINTDSTVCNLQLLSFCNLDQISEIIVTSWPTNGCLLEFDCNEASESEIVGDWALYFPSESQLSGFLTSVLNCRDALTQELLGLTKVSSGRAHNFLMDGATTSKRYWKACV